MTRGELIEKFAIIKGGLKKTTPAFGKIHDLIKELTNFYNENISCIVYRVKNNVLDKNCQQCELHNDNLLLRHNKLICEDCNKLNQKNNKSLNLKKRWENVEYKEKMTKMSKDMWETESHKDKLYKIRSTPEYKQKQSDATTKLWQTKEYSDKCLYNGFKKKEYVFPSGKKILIQGYESFAINDLLKQYNEKDIIAGDELNLLIAYRYCNKDKTYRPDIYIPKENLIIEVKSRWFFELEKEKNLIKENSTKNAGYNFKFIIFDK